MTRIQAGLGQTHEPRRDPALERARDETLEILHGSCPEHPPSPLTRFTLIDDDGTILQRLSRHIQTPFRVTARNDALDAEHALTAHLTAAERVHTMEPLSPSLVADAELIVGQLPKTNAELRALARLAGRHAHPGAVLVLGGREKYLHRSMNDILLEGFAQVRASRGARKARALVASTPRGADTPTAELLTTSRLTDTELGEPLTVCATPGAFAGAKLDLGTRVLLGVLQDETFLADHPELHADEKPTILDLGCGTGVLASIAARQWPQSRVIASDRSQAAILSTLATAEANELAKRIHVQRDLAASTLPARSIDLVLCNPPFHDGLAVDEDLAAPIFRGAARALRPGGVMLTVFNAHLPHRRALERLVGPTMQLHRDPKFIVTRSIRRDER